MLDVHLLIQRFVASFGSAPRIFRAPARVNLIGEHTDYMDGLCLPMTVDRSVVVGAAPRDDDVLRLQSRAYGSAVAFRMNEARRSEPRAWHDVPRGMAAVLGRKGLPTRGAELFMDSDVPIGGGLSSSAAVAVATAQALLALSGRTMTALELSLAVQQVEHEFMGARSGLLDPLAITSGRARHAVLVDCQARTTTLVPFDDDALSVLVFDTRTKHDLAGSGYNERRGECEAGLLRLQRLFPGLTSLRDVSSEQLETVADRIESPLLARLGHVIAENERVEAAVRALAAGRFAAFGRLMLESHDSLARNFCVSSDELDWVVEQARTCPGVFGAKMTGGGFGGCVVVLVAPRSCREVADRLLSGYRQRFGIDAEAYPVVPTEPAGEIHPDG